MRRDLGEASSRMRWAWACEVRVGRGLRLVGGEHGKKGSVDIDIRRRHARVRVWPSVGARHRACGFSGVHTVTVYVGVRCSCPSPPRSPVFVFVRVYFVHSPNPALPLSALTRSVCATNRQPYPPPRPRPHAWLVRSHVILCDRACLFLVVRLCFVCVFVFRSSLFNLPWSPVVCSHACRRGRACEYVDRAATLARNPDRNGVKELGR